MSKPAPDDDRSQFQYVDFTRLPQGSKTILIVMVILVAVAGLTLVKIIRSTPAGFTPKIRVSVLDKLQATSLARSARQEAAAGHWDEAILGWQAAIANDPGNAAMRRGLIETLLLAPEPPRKYLGSGAGTALLLLRLTQTNALDLDLAARLFSSYGLDNQLLGFLKPSEDQLTPVQASVYLKALFHLNAMEAFGQLWPRYQTALSPNPEMRLYLAAWQSGWGPPSTLVSAAAVLAAATTNPATATLAWRLSLPVAASRSDIAAYERALKELEETRSDHIRDHLGHWRLLLRIGQRDRAVELARAFATPPESATEAVSVADTLVGLKLLDTATTFLESQTTVFTSAPELWQRLAELYAQQERWSDLRALTVEARTSGRTPPSLTGLTWYWEGIAEGGTGRTDAARDAMAKAADFPPDDPSIALRMAAGMAKAGFPGPASLLLERIENDLKNEPAYWLQLVASAHELRNFDLLEKAASRGFALATNNPTFINNYAAALLIQRTNAPLAVELTLRRLATAPKDPGANLNHALALLQNGRLEDAERILNRFAGVELPANLASILQFGLFELDLRQGKREAALGAYRKIDSSYLMPPQIRWLEASYQSLTK